MLAADHPKLFRLHALGDDFEAKAAAHEHDCVENRLGALVPPSAPG